MIPSQWRAAGRFAPVLGHQYGLRRGRDRVAHRAVARQPHLGLVGLGTVRRRRRQGTGIAEVRCTACRLDARRIAPTSQCSTQRPSLACH